MMAQVRCPSVRMALHQLPIGEAAVIEELELPQAVEHHLMHMGFFPETRVVAIRRAPAGDPTVYAVDGMEVALRRETAQGVWVTPQAEPINLRRQPGARA